MLEYLKTLLSHEMYCIIVLFSLQGSSQMEDIIQRNAKQSPYLLITSFPARQVFLIVDKPVVCECSVEDVPVMLMSAFFSFNICYTPGCHNYFAFLECISNYCPPKINSLHQ